MLGFFRTVSGIFAHSEDRTGEVTDVDVRVTLLLSEPVRLDGEDFMVADAAGDNFAFVPDPDVTDGYAYDGATVGAHVTVVDGTSITAIPAAALDPGQGSASAQRSNSSSRSLAGRSH